MRIEFWLLTEIQGSDYMNSMKFSVENRREIHEIVRGEIRTSPILLGIKEDIGDLKERVSFLPTKDELYNQMDRIYGELKTVRQEQTFLNAQVSRATGQTESLEQKFQMFTKDFQKPAL